MSIIDDTLIFFGLRQPRRQSPEEKLSELLYLAYDSYLHHRAQADTHSALAGVQKRWIEALKAELATYEKRFHHE